MTELFFEYVAHCNATSEEAASFTTFTRVANKIMGPHLRSGHLHFRKPNDHSKCDACIQLKKAMRKKEVEVGGSDAATRAYSSHILSQWLDRQIYWSFRSLSQSFFQQVAAGERFLRVAVATNAVCLIADGMDQAKFKCPRVRGRDNAANSKLFTGLFRPRLHVAGVWIHGFKLTLYVADEDVCKNSTSQMEMISRALSQVKQQHGSLPFGLCIQQDNTYREGKNRHFLAFCILVVALRCFRWCTTSFLRVGHRSLPALFFFCW